MPNSSSIKLARVVLYVKNVPKIATFYQLHFNLVPLPGATGDWIELAGADGGCAIALHKAAKSQVSGAAIKLVFAVVDVPAFKAAAGKKGLMSGPIHTPGGFKFANAKDPAGNSISISSRGM